MRVSRDHVAAVFEAAPNDPAAPQPKQYLPLKTREKVRSMIAAGDRASKIAKDCDVSSMTVYREKENHPH